MCCRFVSSSQSSNMIMSNSNWMNSPEHIQTIYISTLLQKEKTVLENLNHTGSLWWALGTKFPCEQLISLLPLKNSFSLRHLVLLFWNMELSETHQLFKTSIILSILIHSYKASFPGRCWKKKIHTWNCWVKIQSELFLWCENILLVVILEAYTP